MSDDSKPGSESDNTDHSRKSTKCENIASISIENNSGNEKENSSPTIAAAAAVVQTQPSMTIPALPKPVSARTERNKIVQSLQMEKLGLVTEKCSANADVLDGSEKVTQEPPKNLKPEDHRGHVTVIQLGNDEGISQREENQSNIQVCQSEQQSTTASVVLNHRPDMKRLALEKSPLQETRSLDDSKGRGLFIQDFF